MTYAVALFLLLVAQVARALPSSIVPELMPPTPGISGSAEAAGTITVHTSNPPVWPEIANTELGSQLSEPVIALGPSSMVVDVNDGNLGNVTTASWAMALDGTSVLGTPAIFTGPYGYGSDPSVLWNPLLHKWFRSEINFNIAQLEIDYQTAVVVQLSGDGQHWSTAAVASAKGNGDAASNDFHDHASLAMGALMWLQWNAFPNPDANPAYPVLQTSEDGVTWNPPFFTLTPYMNQYLFDPSMDFTVLGGIQPNNWTNEAGEYAFVPWSMDVEGQQFIELQACNNREHCFPIYGAETPTHLFGNENGHFDWAPATMRLSSNPGIVSGNGALASGPSGAALLLYWMEFQPGAQPRIPARIMTRFSPDAGQSWGPATAVDDPLKRPVTYGDQLLPDANFDNAGRTALCFFQQMWSSTGDGTWTLARRCYQANADATQWTEFKANQPNMQFPDMIHGFLGDYGRMAGRYPWWYDASGYIGTVLNPNFPITQEQVAMNRIGSCAIEPLDGGAQGRAWHILAVFLALVFGAKFPRRRFQS